MMKILVGLLFLSISSYAENLCSVYDFAVLHEFPNWIDLAAKSSCYQKAIRQTQMEINASYTYLSIGAHLAQDVVNRPGFADFFFKAAKTEREHAKKLIKYLSIRGHLNEVSPLMGKPVSLIITPPNIYDGADAFKHALELEEKLTHSIRELIKSCETDDKNSDIVDWLTGVYLEEHIHSKRDLAGKLSQLTKMGPGALGEFLFDKTL